MRLRVVGSTKGSKATKPLPKAGVWGWVKFVNGAEGDKNGFRQCNKDNLFNNSI